MIEIGKIETVNQKIHTYLSPTRLDKSVHLGSNVYLKFECEQPVVRSFKIRGVLGKLLTLSEEEKKKRVVTISSGNQGVSTAYACKLLGLEKPIIYVPETSPEPKIHKMEKFGAEIIKIGQSFDEANVMAERLIENQDYIRVDCREDPDGVCGHASMAEEIMQQNPDVEAIILPMGSGGCSIATGSYIKQRYPKVKVYGVESDESPALIENLKTGQWMKTYPTREDAMLKSLVGGVAQHTFLNAPECVDEILTVSDEEAGQAVADLAKYEKVICEPDSAAAYAAYTKYYDLFEGRVVAIDLSGGNIDNALFKKLIDKYY